MSIRVKVRNFATVATADVQMRDLVVLLGPNNSGKSTLATIMYAISHSQPPSLGSQFYLYGETAGHKVAISLPHVVNFDKRYAPKATRELAQWLIEATQTKEPNLNPPASVCQIMHKPFLKSLQGFSEAITEELERCFGEPIKDLASNPSVGDGALSIRVEHGDQWWLRLSVSKGRIKHEVDAEELDALSWRRVMKNALNRWRRRTTRPSNETAASQLLTDLFNEYTKYRLRYFPNASHYLPAARSGMLHSHRALAAALIRQSSFVGIQDFSVPKLPGIVTDFIGQLLELSPAENGSYREVARYLEDQILHGRVEVVPSAPASPEIRFAAAGSNHALHRTSSMVSELAPVILFLRHVLRHRDLLIIEEPESHLHPASQVKFARALALLIDDRAKVVITTHSDYFLNQLNNLIRVHTLQESTGMPSGSDDVSIAPEAVRAYLFRPQENAGSIVEEIAVDSEQGISDAEFADVADWLYNETAALVRDINVAQG